MGEEHALACRYRDRSPCRVGKDQKWFKYSATIVWARIVAFGGAFIVALGTFADLFDLPGIRENVQVLLAPRYLPYYIIVIAIVTELARRAR